MREECQQDRTVIEVALNMPVGEHEESFDCNYRNRFYKLMPKQWGSQYFNWSNTIKPSRSNRENVSKIIEGPVQHKRRRNIFADGSFYQRR